MCQRAIAWLAMSAVFCMPALAQEADTTGVDSIVLAPFEIVHPSVQRGACASTMLDSTLLMGFDRSSLRSALRFVPGVQFDERGHGGSARLSVRGSLLRSPFGTRNVKVYWGPVPLTLADGSTPLELLDPLLVDHAQVLRGVGPTRYGEAPAGVLLTEPVPDAADGANAFAEVMGGSFGFRRMAASAGAFTQGSGIVAGVVSQRNDGYRDQESSRRDQLFLVSQWTAERLRWQVLLTAQDARWDLPGSLDEQTARDAPTSARAYSEAIDARVEKRQFFGGVSLEQNLGRSVMLRTVVGGGAIDKVNPYGTTAAVSGYKDEENASLSARVLLSSASRFGAVRLEYETGLEGLWQRDRLEERAFVDAVPDTVRIHALNEVSNASPFVGTRVLFPKGWSVIASLGTNVSTYGHTDELRGADPVERRFGGALPMLAVEHQRPRARYHARIAGSNSRPTIWESLGTSGEFNTELSPERWKELEAGVEDEGDRSMVAFTLYHRTVDDIIVEFKEDDGSRFENNGTAVFAGAEGELRMDRALGKDFSLFTIATLGIQYSELEGRSPVAGVEPLSAKLFMRVTWKRNSFAEGSGQFWSGVNPDMYRDAEIADGAVIWMRVGHTFRWRGNGLEAFVLCENLLDVRYDSWVQVNDPGERYHNPAPARSFFAGLRLTFSDAAAGRP